MVNFRDPVEIAKDGVALLKLWHVVDGIYLREYFTTLDLEWDVIRGRRPHRWSFWIYSLTRMAALSAVIINLVIFSTTTTIDCQVTSYLALSAASVLLARRIIAIWNKNKVVVAIAMCLWVVNGAFIIHAVSRIRGARSAPTDPCTTLNAEVTKMALIASFVTDLVMLIIMLVGLLRLGYHRESSLALGRFLWSQGVIWLLIAMVVGVIPVVLNIMNLSEPLNEMFQFPWLITVVIAATRMYRALHDFSSPVLHRHTYRSPQGGSAIVSIRGAQGITSAEPISLGRIKVDVHTSNETSHDGIDGSAEKRVKDELDDPRGLV